MEAKEKHNVKYSCGCVHEIELNGVFWQSTGKDQNCDTHKQKAVSD